MSNKLEVKSPYDERVINALDMQDANDVDKALSVASALAKDNDARIPTYKRIEILEKTALLVEENIEKFALEAAEEGGKPLIDSRIELVRAVQGIQEAARSLGQLTGREIPMNLNAASANRAAYTFREPIGVVAAISAFNHPFNLIVHQAVPAIAVGCPVIVKPSLTTPISCINLVNTLYEAGLPEEWCQVMISENEDAEKLVTDPRVDLLTFIGSARVGWHLRSQLAPGTRVTLEHGGSAPVIFEADADLDEALPLLAKGGYYHAGQVCVSVQRVFVHESITDEFSRRLKTIAEGLAVGDPMNDSTEVGPLILNREVDRVEEWVREAKAGGTTVLTGGERISDSLYAPTILVDPPSDIRVSQEEIFGPVINIYPYKDRLDAIKRANDIPYSFQAAIFTKDLDVAFDSVKRLIAAAVMVNDHTAFRVDWMPFAGRKASGIGIGGILPTMEEMTEEKLIVFKSKVL